ncbi:hypothetical protein ANCCAN_18749 [Ancylostoma caninum]|uniref:Reverse transcriptase domain-containing protein n=1 Tax=Ancylostoma caninum TaxID=29170 RepID=A0A368FTG6_ANCCA|nr:hypothetical protein ANCCAN_18749 [Ancylostoma caninum]
MIRKCNWDEYGVNVNGRMFADEIVPLTNTPQEAGQMVRQLNQEGKKVGLQLNAKKTKISTAFIISGCYQINNLR